ncbi:hypothetical protein KO481_28015 [Nocardia sp. NEAU-G5]|uniref:Terpene synthase n=2 Tax=Nocardia albiluteola TaxID=2842303 RepID=A0ABS6B4Y5_9NOCA|nr:hypothetical protein [Nocardia albiluteola]
MMHPDSSEPVVGGSTPGAVDSPAGISLPFPVDISPDLESARRSHNEWMVRHRLLCTDDTRALAQYRNTDLPRLAALVWPYARGADLELGCDVVGWTLVFDDWFDSGLELQSVNAVIDRLIDVLTGPERPVERSAPPLVHAFSDIWSRCSADMPASWRRRAAHNWEFYLCANMHEATERGLGRIPSLDHFLCLRRGTVCLENYLDLCERLGGFHVTPKAFHIPQLRQLRRLAALIPALTNDVVTLPKEENAGEVNNLVLVLERQHGCDRDEALDAALKFIEEKVAQFVALTADMPTLADRYRLPAQEQHHINRYVDAQRLWMGGFEEWSRRTPRYTNQPTETEPKWQSKATLRLGA